MSATDFSTPVPWERHGMLIVAQGRGIIARIPPPSLEGGGVFDCNENADLIVEAVNSYDALKAKATKGEELARAVLQTHWADSVLKKLAREVLGKK